MKGVVFFLLLAVALVGCRGPEGPVGPEGPAGTLPVFITGYVESPFQGDTTSDVRVEVSNVSGIPVVYVNDVNIPLNMRRGTYGFFDYDFPISAGDSARLRVEHAKYDGGLGISQADVKLPGHFMITSHDTSGYDTIPFGNQLTITWNSSEGADLYHALVRLSCRYRDTTDVEQLFYLDFDTLFMDTSIIFASSEIFPDTTVVDSLIYYHGDFVISSLSGPWQEGEPGNITGDGIGYFHGWTSGAILHFVAVRN